MAGKTGGAGLIGIHEGLFLDRPESRRDSPSPSRLCFHLLWLCLCVLDTPLVLDFFSIVADPASGVRACLD